MSMIEKCARAAFACNFHPDDAHVAGDYWDERRWPEATAKAIRTVRAVLSVLMEADEEVMLEGFSYVAVDPDLGAFKDGWKAMIRHILNEETDGRLPSGRAGGAIAPQPAPRSSRDACSSLTHGWQPMETAPKDGTPVLACRDNGCRWEFTIVMWSEHPVYPWLEHPFTLNDNAYPEGRMDYWRPLEPPYPITFDDADEEEEPRVSDGNRDGEDREAG